MNIVSYFIFFIITFSLLSQVTLANNSLISPVVSHERAHTFSIGAIFDDTCRSGKEAKVAINMVLQDFNSVENQDLRIHFSDSQGKPVRAALAAKDLISTKGVKVILGAHTWDETAAIAEASSDESHDVRVLSFADSTPTTKTFPCVHQVIPSQMPIQMNAIAAIVKSMGLHQVTFIHDNAPALSSSEFIVSELSRALEQSGGELFHILSLGSFSLNSLEKELNRLKKQKHRVFVVHASLESGNRLYQNAKKLNMTGNGYAWITTSSIIDLFHSISPKNMSLMQGIIGTKTYNIHENSLEFQDFRKRFRSNFRKIYPDEDFDEPGVFAWQAYDAIQTLLYEDNITNFLRRFSVADCSKSSTEFQMNIAPPKVVEIVNVIGKSYQSGYWTEGLGFSKTIGDEAVHHTSMAILEEVLWPAQPWHTERLRRNLAGRSETLRVGVPAESLFKQFVIVGNDSKTNGTSYDGFSIKVFEEVMRRANVNNYNYIPFRGTYDDMVKNISVGVFDAVAGDVTIIEKRHEHADFSQPYTESGMVLIVPVRSKFPDRMWLFMRPFTPQMWGLIVAITIYNGFTVWLIERNRTPEFRSGTLWNQIGTLFWLSFTTLFTLRGDRLHSNLSRITMVVWLFVALIITQSYTASLASMLTAQRLEPAIKDIETLRRMNATVGYCKGSFLKDYMVSALGFESTNIRKFGSTHAYAEALNTREIAGIFLETPSAKVFLAQYCKSFIKTEKTFKVGGFGFAFTKGFAMLPEINRAIMNITENGKLLELEQRYINSEQCTDSDTNPDEDASIGLNSFSILFLFTGCTSTAALVMYAIRNHLYPKPQRRKMSKSVSAIIKKWRQYKRQGSARVISVEDPRIPHDPYLDTRQSFSTVSTTDLESLDDHIDALERHNQV